MNIGVIIAEYNPFHNGHAWQIQQLRTHGISHVVVIMSGNFVQRGDVAIFSKWVRAQVAVQAGADLVIDLPTMVAMAPAREFANGAIRLAKKLGLCSLWFGSECADIEQLRKTYEYIQQAEQNPLFQQILSTGYSHPKTRELTVKRIYGVSYAEILCAPNNLLGLEYLRAIAQQQATITPYTLPRIETQHDDKTPGKNIASASFLRKKYTRTSIASWKPYVPINAFKKYEKEIENGTGGMCLEQLTPIILFHLRTTNIKQLKKIVGVSEGLEHRILRCSKQAKTLEDCLNAITTKRYSSARIRRILISAVLGIQQDEVRSPQYFRILACSKNGAAVLKWIKNNQQTKENDLSMPIVSKFSVLKHHTQAQFESKATDLFSLAAPTPLPSGLEFTTSPWMA